LDFLNCDWKEISIQIGMNRKNRENSQSKKAFLFLKNRLKYWEFKKSKNS